MKSQRVDTWVASIPDRPGALAAKLKALAAGGCNLELVIARRLGDKGGKGVVFVTPIKGAKQVGAAGEAGFARSSSLHTLRIEGPDKPGQGGRIATALADQGLNLRGFSAAAIGKKFICYIALDTEADVVRAARILREM
ncbi:MAG: amino acid-binding protein [Verrucomicrobia bacterium]|nr:amino acid-binding protein [Verrucomicrobiota bacterium]